MKKFSLLLLTIYWLIPAAVSQRLGINTNTPQETLDVRGTGYFSGKLGIGVFSPLAQLHVKDSSVLFTGAYPLPANPGNPPIEGIGVRMMWYPDKAAFRAGYTGYQWNKDSIGDYSMALGNIVLASGLQSTALGSRTRATGNASTALGFKTEASGGGATAMGNYTIASGAYSTAMGVLTIAKANGGMTVGFFNDDR